MLSNRDPWKIYALSILNQQAPLPAQNANSLLVQAGRNLVHVASKLKWTAIVAKLGCLGFLRSSSARKMLSTVRMSAGFRQGTGRETSGKTPIQRSSPGLGQSGGVLAAATNRSGGRGRPTIGQDAPQKHGVPGHRAWTHTREPALRGCRRAIQEAGFVEIVYADDLNTFREFEHNVSVDSVMTEAHCVKPVSMRSEPLPEAREDESKLWRAVRPRSQFSLVSVFCLLVVACFAAESRANNDGTQGPQLSDSQSLPRGHCSAEAPVTKGTKTSAVMRTKVAGMQALWKNRGSL